MIVGTALQYAAIENLIPSDAYIFGLKAQIAIGALVLVFSA